MATPSMLRFHGGEKFSLIDYSSQNKHYSSHKKTYAINEIEVSPRPNKGRDASCQIWSPNSRDATYQSPPPIAPKPRNINKYQTQVRNTGMMTGNSITQAQPANYQTKKAPYSPPSRIPAPPTGSLPKPSYGINTLKYSDGTVVPKNTQDTYSKLLSELKSNEKFIDKKPKETSSETEENKKTPSKLKIDSIFSNDLDGFNNQLASRRL